MSQVQLLAALLSMLATFSLAAIVPPPKASPPETGIKGLSRKLVTDTRTLASEAKKGMAIELIFKNALKLQADASSLIQSLNVSECETNLVIKMAAAGIGSHEVLTLLLADDAFEVLNGRLSLSLVFLERVAQQLEDELALSTDVGPHLAAIVFGTNATSSIAETADEVVKAIIPLADNIDNDDRPNSNNVVRRQFDLGRGFQFGDSGFSLGLNDGLKWQSSTGRTSVNVKPDFSKGGVAGTFKHTLPNGRTSFSLTPSWNEKEGAGVSGRVEHTFKNGNSKLYVEPSWKEKDGPSLGVGFSFRN